jgi:hypothetical protein
MTGQLKTWALRAGLVAVALALALMAAEIVRKSYIIGQLGGRLTETEGQLVDSEGALVAARGTQRALLDEADRLQRQLEELTKQLGEKPKIVETVKWRVRELEVPVPGPPREVTCPHGAVVPCPDCPPVRLAISGVEARVDTQAGNLIAVGSVRVKRTAPPPEEVWDLPWESGRLTAAPAPANRVRWSLGPRVLLDDAGVQYGVAAVTPPARLGRLELRGGVDATADFQGRGTVGVSFLFGWGRR